MQPLIGLLDIVMSEEGVNLEYYKMDESKFCEYAKFINGQIEVVDGIPSPLTEEDFDTESVEKIIDKII